MSPLASWLVLGGIVFAAVAFGLFVVWLAGGEQWDDRPRRRR
jgi:hypothetical protein